MTPLKLNRQSTAAFFGTQCDIIRSPIKFASSQFIKLVLWKVSAILLRDSPQIFLSDILPQNMCIDISIISRYPLKRFTLDIHPMYRLWWKYVYPCIFEFLPNVLTFGQGDPNRSENTVIPYSYLKCWQVGLVVPLQEMRRECSCSIPIKRITSLLGLCATFDL